MVPGIGGLLRLGFSMVKIINPCGGRGLLVVRACSSFHSSSVRHN